MNRVLLAAVALTFGANVMAQTCATPLPIGSNMTVSGDTCTAENSLPGYGGTPSPQREIVYGFTAENADAQLIVTLNGLPDGAAFLMPSPCSSATDPTNFGFSGAPMVVAPGSLTDGAEYFIIVTSDPSGPADACGEFEVEVDGILPVELQSFSID